MQKRNQFISGAFKRHFMNQTHACVRCLLQLPDHIINTKCDVVDTFAILFQELCDRTFRRSRLKQFNVNLTRFKERGANFLRFDFFTAMQMQAKCFFIILDRIIETVDGDAEVIYLLNHNLFFGLMTAKLKIR